MKYLFFTVMFLISLGAFGQNMEEEEPKLKKNEITLNLFDLVVAGTLELGYERMLKNNQSVVVNLNFWDTFGYYDLGDNDYKSNAFSLQLAYYFYFSKRKEYKGFLFYPYMRFRGGSVEYEDYYYNGPNMDVKNDIGGFQLGFGLGYKWRIYNDRVSLGINGEIARQLGGKIDTDLYSKVEPRLAVNLGFLF